ncbi:dienelactone hydrolase [Novosphingobium sediminis]|uniref:Dienelactone hydrolase n=1 Tax=Novosphingobium sediminis TaxID=707214 RepID=A0A512AP82_9SPHN|nr:acyl-CoA thioester hydrolase/BAAT C-terminal domain-containing protein [Novosphingobium sediminis]GEO01519.1 dienelactone hydrolase [Novosphingobium sediminis]
MRKALKRGAIALGFGVALVTAGGAWLAAHPWGPPIELVDPGAGGTPIRLPTLVGNFYPGAGEGRRPAILLLGGSEGGLGAAVDGQARLLAQEGFAVFALAYYRLPGQPKRFELVPLETLTGALDWLKAHSGVDPARLAIMGTSKGAEAALLVASRRADITAVVAAVPSQVAWQGFDWSFAPVKTSSWSEGGKPVPYLPITTVGWNGDIYGPALADAAKHPEAAIPVERIAGPVLLLCGEDDKLWPSCRMARAVKARRDEQGNALATTLLAYPDAGHFGVGPQLPAGDSVPAMITMFGGSKEGNVAARADGWPRTIAFLKQALAPAANKETDR